MTWELAESGIELSEFSALIAVGGDGTYHDVINGMLHRADKKRIPVGFVPNGSGNDMLRALGVTDIAKALDYIVKGDLLKADLVKVLLDCENESDIPLDDKEERRSKYRYQLVNSSFNVPAKLNRRATGWKWCCCMNPYEVAAVIEFTKLVYEPVDIYVDGSAEPLFKDVETPFLMCLSGKHGGNGCLLNPIGVINDGLIELLVVKGRVGPAAMVRYMNQSTKEGGIHVYDKDVSIVRGHTFKLVSKRKSTPETPPHVLAIDGEVLYFKDTLKY